MNLNRETYYKRQLGGVILALLKYISVSAHFLEECCISLRISFQLFKRLSYKKMFLLARPMLTQAQNIWILVWHYGTINLSN